MDTILSILGIKHDFADPFHVFQPGKLLHDGRWYQLVNRHHSKRFAARLFAAEAEVGQIHLVVFQ